jgi:hypothetical protein
MKNDTLCKPEDNGSMFILDTIEFKSTAAVRDKGFHMIKQSILQEEITSINTYAPSCRAPKKMKQKLTEMQRKIDINTTEVSGF